MKKSRKGLTLIEVLVAISVFSIISFALLSSIILMKKVVNQQEEYTKLEMVCNDMKVYYEKCGAGWAKEYFQDEKQENIGYFNSNFQIADEGEEKYKIEFSNDTILSISSTENKIYVENIPLSNKKGNNQ